jgi:predicted component of type VI protein secretion system
MTLLALSINGGIKTLGAYAGLAAVIALALLALLYFSQARELKRLSEWAERESARRQAPPTPQGARPPPAAPPPAPAVMAPVPAGPGAPVVTTVEGVRRVPIPTGAAGEMPPAPPVVAAPPDATTLSGEVAVPAETDVVAPAEGTPTGDASGAEAPPVAPFPPAPAPAGWLGVETAQPSLPPAPAAQPLPRLIAEAVPGQPAGTTHEIGAGLLIGRGKVASLRLSDPLASARHARISKQADRFMLEDLGSTNGTFVNGVLISAPTQLGERDRIRLGESEFTFALAPGTTPDPNGGTGQVRPAAVPLLAAAAPEREVELPVEDPPPAAHRHLRLPFSHDEAPSTQAGLPPAPDPERPAGRGRWLAVVAIVVALAAVAFAVVELAPGSGPKKPAQHATTPPASSGATATTTQKRGSASGPAPSTVTVAVFNGTGRPGLAGTVSSKLASDGYAKSAVANAAAQTTTTVGYGTGERAAALEVARSLGLPASDVGPMTSTAAGAAGGAEVAVTLGASYGG